MGKKRSLDSEINVQKIMEKIREDIRKRKEAQKVHDSTDLKKNLSDIKGELESMGENWDIENKSYRIFSHRKLLGPVLITGRELVHSEIRRYVDPALSKQREFNASTLRVLDSLSRQISEINKQLRNNRPSKTRR